MSLRLDAYICCKCGKRFRKWVGGIIMMPVEMELKMRPLCDACRFETGKAIFRKNAKGPR